MIVVKALTHSPWGTYTVAFTIPLALFMGIYIRYLRPGRIGEVSVIGLVFPGVRHYLRRLGGGKPHLGAVV
ncbi:carbon starvation protein CstA [Enterobacter cancerogenus]|uniref:Carbon starvation protein CstA n=1 Tax=Enterobacter cancerogenus TaxID=69218 RepID=A0A484WZR0_9ENTR|nr:carbon starvation protein CstA [Enterobacter cancerogenus]